MKVLLINDYATRTGGAENLSLALRDGLKRRGYDARLLASSARPLGATSFADYECLGSLSSFRTVLQTFNPWAWWKLRQVLREFDPDLVHVTLAFTQLSPLILPLLRNVPTVYNAQWYRAICPVGTKALPNKEVCHFDHGLACRRNRCLSFPDWLLLSVQMYFIDRNFNVFDRVVSASHAVKKRLSAAGINSEVIWNGTPVCPGRQPLTSLPTVVFAGRLVWEKGVDVLLESFARVQQQIPEATLLIAGDGIERGELESMVARLDLQEQVFFLGHLSSVSVESAFKEAWVQVVPSRWAEPFGLVAAEAHMRGTAVIASNQGGLTEIVSDGETGFLVPPDNSIALAEKLVTILQDRKLAESFGKKGREVVLEKFSENAYVDNFLALYKILSGDGTIRGN